MSAETKVVQMIWKVLWQSRSRIVKYDSRAFSSPLEQSYHTKQLRLRLTAAVNYVYQG